VLLVQSLKLANKPDMQDIGAVSELRIYLQTQEAVRPAAPLRRAAQR
jgi:hypothetical protein